MSEPALITEGLTKHYRVPVRAAGLRASLRSLVHREYRLVEAVSDIDFRIEPGEIVGFLGPNGAGKTTTLKMLSGLLHPTAGTARVLGAEPWRREAAFLRQMTLVMGQKNQLIWDIPAMDTFLMNQAIYNLPQVEFRRTLDAFLAQLEIGDLLDKPVRNLSLGERMKCELVAALLHRPQVLFLDEPTLGLDVTMQSRIRAFIREYNRETGATVLLTSHYMADIEALCERVIVIHHGRLLFDGRLRDLIERTAPYKVLRVAFETPYAAQLAEEWGEVVERTPAAVALRVPKSRVREVTGRLLAEWPVADVSVEDPPVEHVIEQVFAGGASAG